MNAGKAGDLLTFLLRPHRRLASAGNEPRSSGFWSMPLSLNPRLPHPSSVFPEAGRSLFFQGE